MNPNQDNQPLFDLEAVFEVDDYLYFYSDDLTDERTEAEVSALIQLLELDRPLKILDLACGFGRHANRLAALGHQVIGVDLTAGFLDIARRDASQRGVQVEYVRGDMRSIHYRAEFDRVMLLFTAFGYFEDGGNLAVMKNIAHALKPGGLLAFDTHNRDVILKNTSPSFVIEKDGNLLIDRLSFDCLTGRWNNQRIVIRDGVRKDKPFSIRVYNANEIQALLGQAGLEVHKICGGWDGSPLSSEARRMVVIARK